MPLNGWYIKKNRTSINRETIQKLTDAAGEVAKKYSTGTIIKYINSEYESLFGKGEDGVTEISENMQAAFFPLVEFCIKYQSGVDNQVFLFLAENKWFIYITY